MSIKLVMSNVLFFCEYTTLQLLTICRFLVIPWIRFIFSNNEATHESKFPISFDDKLVSIISLFLSMCLPKYGRFSCKFRGLLKISPTGEQWRSPLTTERRMAGFEVLWRSARGRKRLREISLASLHLTGTPGILQTNKDSVMVITETSAII